MLKVFPTNHIIYFEEFSSQKNQLDAHAVFVVTSLVIRYSLFVIVLQKLRTNINIIIIIVEEENRNWNFFFVSFSSSLFSRAFADLKNVIWKLENFNVLPNYLQSFFLVSHFFCSSSLRNMLAKEYWTTIWNTSWFIFTPLKIMRGNPIKERKKSFYD